MLIYPGFGPADVLSANAIPVISALSGVGQNLWDQIFLNALHGITVPNTSTYVSTLAQQAIPLQQYYANASGPYSSARGYLSFEKIPAKDRKNFSARTAKALTNFPSDWPEIE
jgi:choline dehydrogenase